MSCDNFLPRIPGEDYCCAVSSDVICPLRDSCTHTHRLIRPLSIGRGGRGENVVTNNIGCCEEVGRAVKLHIPTGCMWL